MVAIRFFSDCQNVNDSLRDQREADERTLADQTQKGGERARRPGAEPRPPEAIRPHRGQSGGDYAGSSDLIWTSSVRPSSQTPATS